MTLSLYTASKCVFAIHIKYIYIYICIISKDVSLYCINLKHPGCDESNESDKEEYDELVS